MRGAAPLLALLTACPSSHAIQDMSGTPPHAEAPPGAPPAPPPDPSPDPPPAGPAPAPLTGPPPPGMVDLRAALPGACFDVRYATADNFTGAPLPGYEVPGAWLRAGPAAALARAQASLAAQGLALLIHDAYRPVRASLAMVAWAERTGQRRLIEDGYIARRSGHNRGDTVDVALARAGTCEPLDMGSPWDLLGPESHTENAVGAPLERRRLLRQVLSAEGFVPYAREWWHFSANEPGARPLDVPYLPP